MKNNTNYIWVAGFHVEDLSTEIDLTKLGNQDIIRFSEGNLTIKKGSELRLFHGNRQYVFKINLKVDNNNENKEKYYSLKGGSKYELIDDPISLSSLNSNTTNEEYIGEPNTRTNGSNYLLLPCNTKAWGGGGLNMLLSIRALSRKEITHIRYWDLNFGSPVEDMIRELEDLHLKATKALNNSDKSGGIDKFSPERKAQVIEIVSRYSPEDSIEFFLRKNHVDYDLFPSAKKGSNNKVLRRNLVLSRVTDGQNTIGDKIIFKSPVPELNHEGITGDESNKNLIQHIRNSFRNVSTVVINTVKHYDVFKSIIKAYIEEIAESKKGSTNTHSEIKMKLFLIFTDDNRKLFIKLREDQPSLYDGVFEHIYGIFNEKEFIAFMRYVEETAPKTADFLFDDGSFNFEKLIDLCVKYRDHFKASSTKRLYVTCGRHGSAGVDDNNELVYVKTFPTRGVPIYSTSGCGDAWGGTIVLMEHHRDCLDQDQGKISRFMRIASGTAWARMTNPLGQVRIHEVVSILENEYIAFCRVGVAQDERGKSLEILNEDGHLKRIQKASSIDYSEYRHLIRW